MTPAPGSAHQVVLSRLLIALGGYLSTKEGAFAVSPGEIEIAPKTLLEPDLLVFPATYAPGTKRDAYLSLGVDEVWLVDIDERVVFASRRGAERDVRQAERLVWRPAAMREPLEIDLASLFRGMP